MVHICNGINNGEIESLPPRLGVQKLVMKIDGGAEGGSLLHLSADGRIFVTKAAVILGIVLKLKEDDPVHGSLPRHGL